MFFARICALLTLTLPLHAAELKAAGSITPEMDRYLMDGLDHIFRMDFDAAERASKKVIALNPDHPYGYFGVASAAWTRYVYETEQTDQSLIPAVEKQMEEVVARSQSWLKTHPGDAHVLMVQGSAYGLIARLLCMRREWMRAYFSGRKAVSITRAALKADPQLYDAYLGIGMYDYYSDVYQRVVGVLAKLVLGGNRLRGIEELKLVAKKGRYSKISAKMILVEIYNEDKFGSKDPEEALKIIKEVRSLYPDSAMLHAAQLVSFYSANRYDDAVKGARSYLKREQEGKYRPIERAKGNVILGTALWALNNKAKALEALKAGAGVKFGDQLSRWAVWSHIRAGQLEDLMGLRQQAVADYRAAAGVPDYWGLRAFAKAHLRKPYKHDGHPGPIQSPD